MKHGRKSLKDTRGLLFGGGGFWNGFSRVKRSEGRNSRYLVAKQSCRGVLNLSVSIIILLAASAFTSHERLPALCQSLRRIGPSDSNPSPLPPAVTNVTASEQKHAAPKAYGLLKSDEEMDLKSVCGASWGWWFWLDSNIFGKWEESGTQYERN